MGRRLPVLGFAAGSRLLGLHYLKKSNQTKKKKNRTFVDTDLPAGTSCCKKGLVVSRFRIVLSPSVLRG